MVQKSRVLILKISDFHGSKIRIFEKNLKFLFLVVLRQLKVMDRFFDKRSFIIDSSSTRFSINRVSLSIRYRCDLRFETLWVKSKKSMFVRPYKRAKKVLEIQFAFSRAQIDAGWWFRDQNLRVLISSPKLTSFDFEAKIQEFWCWKFQTTKPFRKSRLRFLEVK